MRASATASAVERLHSSRCPNLSGTPSHAEIPVNLNHLNLTVTSPAETSRFLQKYFEMRPMGEQPQDNASMAFLTDDNGMVLALLRGKKGVEISYPAAFHVGFIQPTEAK